MCFLQQFDSMSLKCFQKLSFLLFMLALVVPALQFDWQGAGNMTRDNMTEIQTLINNRAFDYLSNSEAINEDARKLSTSLNTLWAPAWNVVIVLDYNGFDVIVYGYAFRGHWMWMNRVPLKGAETSNNKLSYVIWKDYNCNTWQTVLSLLMAESTFMGEQVDEINGITYTGVMTDIWALGHSVVEYINTNSFFDIGAYTAVMSQSASASFYGYICLVDNNYVVKNSLENDKGSMFLFQTR